MASKPVAVFTTGAGDQASALQNIERIVQVFNPEFVKPGIAIETVSGRALPWEVDKTHAAELGERLAKAVMKEKPFSQRRTCFRKPAVCANSILNSNFVCEIWRTQSYPDEDGSNYAQSASESPQKEKTADGRTTKDSNTNLPPGYHYYS